MLVGKWGIVDFNFMPKKANGKLTDKEIETVSMMKKTLSANPKFMKFNLNADGTINITPDQGTGSGTWKLSKNILTIKTTKKEEKYEVRLLSDDKVEWKALKSNIAIPIMTLEKD